MSNQEKKLNSGNNGKELGKDLSERQRRLIPFIVSANTIEEGCRQAGISTVTFYSYLRDPLFTEELRKARDAAVAEAMESLKAATTKAVDKLVALLDSQDEGIRRKAAVDVLTFISKWREFHEIEDRLVYIERLALERRTYR